MAKNTARAEAFMTQRGVKWDGRLLKLGVTLSLVFSFPKVTEPVC